MTKVDYVVNGLLCYLTSARHNHTDQALLSVCQSFYSADIVSDAKKILYAYSNDIPTSRRGGQRVKSDLEDTIALLRKFDEEKVALPKFVCDDYAALPPVSGYEVIAGHMVELLTEIDTLKREVHELKKVNEALKLDSVVDLKEDIFDIKTMLMQINVSDVSSSNIKPSNQTSYAKKVTEKRSSFIANKSDEIFVSLPSDSPAKKLTGPSQKVNDNSERLGNKKQTPLDRTANNHVYAISNDVTENSQMKTEQPWQIVKNRKPRNVIKGVRTDYGSLKGVQITNDIYIGRCDSSVTVDTLSQFIKNEVEVPLLKCECISNENATAKSFKVKVNGNDVVKIFDASVWPENIHVRKFFYKSKNVKSNS